ncbi:MAG TPA: hypothetical protein VNW89_17130 [Stellaceae bacterium]|nr:hypothetical protein [Stellaceae bacterium]
MGLTTSDDLPATKMLIDMMKDVGQKTGAAPPAPPEAAYREIIASLG